MVKAPCVRNQKAFSCDKQRTAYFKEHSSLFSIEVTGQDVPQPDDDTMAAVKSSVVDCVFPEKEGKTTVMSILNCLYE